MISNSIVKLFNKKYTFELFIFILVLIIGSILRLYNIDKLDYFTYDQARNALYTKRMIVDHDFRLIGVQTSLSGLYLPPYYYLSLVPSLLLFNLNPVGIDIFTAFLGIGTIILVYIIGNKIFRHPAGLFSAGIMAVSPIIVQLSRRAWDPSILPFFTLTTFFSFYKSYKEKNLLFYLLGFCLYGYCLSLGLSVLSLFPMIVFIWAYFVLNTSKSFVKKTKTFFIYLFLPVLIIFIFVSPLIAFEFKHDFVMSKTISSNLAKNQLISFSLGTLISSVKSLDQIFSIIFSGVIKPNYFESGLLFNKIPISSSLSIVAEKPIFIIVSWWGTAIFLLILATLILVIFSRKIKFDKMPLFIILIWLVWGVIVSNIYQGASFFYRYLFLLPAPILLFGFMVSFLWKNKFFKIFLTLGWVAIMLYLVLNSTVFSKTQRTIVELKEISGIISKNISDDKWNVATVQSDPDRWDHNAVDYRYFIETFEKKNITGWDPQDYINSKQLFVIDESGKADILNSNIMEISIFKPKKIIEVYSTGKNVKIYKLSN